MPDNDDLIELTEDGYPIGDIAIANGAPVVRQEDSMVLQRKKAALDASLEDLTDGAEVDESVLCLYEGFNDDELRKKVLKSYLGERLTFAELSKKYKVPSRTISLWAYNGRWDALLRREIQAEQEHDLLKLTELRNSRRLKVALAQLDAAEKIRESALEGLDSGEVRLKSAAEAVKSAADVETRILGISVNGALDRGEKSEAEKEAGASAGKQTLVVNFNGNLPPIQINQKVQQ